LGLSDRKYWVTNSHLQQRRQDFHHFQPHPKFVRKQGALVRMVEDVAEQMLLVPRTHALFCRSNFDRETTPGAQKELEQGVLEVRELGQTESRRYWAEMERLHPLRRGSTKDWHLADGLRRPNREVR
jgi:hypothetical protein